MQQLGLKKSPLCKRRFQKGRKTFPYIQIAITGSPKQNTNDGPINQSSRPVAVLLRRREMKRKPTQRISSTMRATDTAINLLPLYSWRRAELGGVVAVEVEGAISIYRTVLLQLIQLKGRRKQRTQQGKDGGVLGRLFGVCCIAVMAHDGLCTGMVADADKQWWADWRIGNGVALQIEGHSIV